MGLGLVAVGLLGGALYLKKYLQNCASLSGWESAAAKLKVPVAEADEATSIHDSEIFVSPNLTSTPSSSTVSLSRGHGEGMSRLEAGLERKDICFYD